jgi:predicted kinase
MKKKIKTVIFDIDGTLADLTHRLHHVKNGNRRWDLFFALCDEDAPIPAIIELNEIVDLAAFYKIVLVSGRSNTVREKTKAWLAKHKVRYEELHMRAEGDYRKDYIIKEEILRDLQQRNHEIIFVVDDRPSVVKMWREKGITCLQCAEWNETLGGTPKAKGLLTLMVGPSGAGKSTWLAKKWFQPVSTSSGIEVNVKIDLSHIVSSDQIRADLCGDFRDQTKNDEVFKVLHEVVKCRINNGLPTIVDATNIKRADRMGVVALAEGSPVRYIVINRPMEEKYSSAGWRAELPFDLIAKHEQTFQSQIKDILAGDHLPNVIVMDMRNTK